MGPGSGQTPSDAPGKLLAATQQLLGEVRPDAITVRAIAERAGLQHSLVHRHFGSRDALVAVALGVTLAERAELIAAAADLDSALAALIETFVDNPMLSAALGTLIADGLAPTVERYPIVEAIEAKLTTSGVAAEPARETALLVLIMVSSWAAAEPWWLRVSGLEDADAGRAVVQRAVHAIVADALARARDDEASA